MSIELNAQEAVLKDEIEKLVRALHTAFGEGKIGQQVSDWIVEAGKKAHELHMSLKERGIEPRHHKYMVENRGMPADHPDFYMHFHPLEDLLKYLHDPHANDDPEDQTIGEEFTFAVYSNRWGHNDTYRIIRTQVGWDVQHLAIGGPCDKGGKPFLYQNFRQDSIQYPSDLSDWMERLWEQAEDQGLSKEEVQGALQELADWVSTVERSRPTGDVWHGY